MIEKAPFKFYFTDFNEMEYPKYAYYKATDKEGRYLYWDKFKWRVEKDEDVKKAWWATKFNRTVDRKYITLSDKKNEAFSFCIPDAIQSKLFQILSLASKGVVPQNSIKEQYFQNLNLKCNF